MTLPVIVICGAPAWAEAAARQLQDAYAVRLYRERVSLVARLADDGAAFILVDGADPDWLAWVTTPKTSPATRRIPIVVVANDRARRADALDAGADLALGLEELLADLPALTRDYARVPDAAYQEALACGCQEPLPPLAREGVARFNAGEYYAQHDLFEEQWMNTEGPVRDLYRAILQVGVAYYQIERGNYRGALKMLLRSVQWLALLPDVCQGVDVKQLRDDSYRVRAALERMNPGDIARFDRGLLKPVRLVKP